MIARPPSNKGARGIYCPFRLNHSFFHAKLKSKLIAPFATDAKRSLSTVSQMNTKALLTPRQAYEATFAFLNRFSSKPSKPLINALIMSACIEKAFSEARAVRAKAIHFEYDMDNDWQSDLFVCPLPQRATINILL